MSDQLSQLNAELRALREENAEQRRLLEQSLDAIETDVAISDLEWSKLLRKASKAIAQHLKGGEE